MKKVNKATLWPVGHMSLYKFIHFTLFTVLRIWAALRSLVLTIVDVVDSYTGVTPTLLSEVCVLPKLPKHISFMLTSAEADSNVISSAARLISYSVLSGIPYVSVYDPEGVLKKHRAELIKRARFELQCIVGTANAAKYTLNFMPSVSEKLSNEEEVKCQTIEFLKRIRAEFGGATAAQDSVLSESERAEQERRKRIERLTNFEGKPSAVQPNTTNVMLLSREDGKDAVVLLTVLLSKYISDPTFKSECSIETENIVSNGLIHDLLSRIERQLWPLPDFVVSFDKLPILGNFPPWLLRYSEIYLGNVGRLVTYKGYLRALRSYAKCVQRYGT